jgi:hypothetical protein
VRRHELILQIPSVTVAKETAEKLIEELHALAEQRATTEFAGRLRAAYRADPAEALKIDPQAAGEQNFVERNMANLALRQFVPASAYEKYTFLSESKNVQVEGDDLRLEDLPKDLDMFIARADGPAGRWVNVQMKARFVDFNDARNRAVRQIVIQGDDPDWVAGVHARLKSLVEPERNAVRDWVYRHILFVFWATVLLVATMEYRLVQRILPTTSLEKPLGTLGTMLVVGVLLGTTVMMAELFLKGYGYFFPYFEVDGNLSRSRFGLRTVVVAGLTAFYVAAFTTAAYWIVGPKLARLFGH